jgi:hypothetical protein
VVTSKPATVKISIPACETPSLASIFIVYF